MNGHRPHTLECLPFFSRSTGEIMHYTCNAPSRNTLKKYSIIAVGSNFGCKDPREVLRIPLKVYQNFGFNEVNDRLALNLNLERLMVLLN